MTIKMHQERWKGTAQNGMTITPDVVLRNARFWIEDELVDEAETLSHLNDHVLWQIGKYREDLVHVEWALSRIGKSFERTTPLSNSFKRTWFRYKQQGKTPKECFQLLERITAVRSKLLTTASDALAQRKPNLARSRPVMGDHPGA